MRKLHHSTVYITVDNTALLNAILSNAIHYDAILYNAIHHINIL